MSGQNQELARITLSVIFIGVLIAGSLWVLSPFIAALIWATMIVVATWPLMLRVQGWLGGRRSLAVLAMTLVLIAIFVIPATYGFKAIFAHTQDFSDLKSRIAAVHIPPPPSWVGGIPIVGARALARWTELAQTGLGDVVARAEPYAQDSLSWLAHKAGGFALLTVQFLLIVILSAVLYSGGEAWGGWVCAFGRRLAGERGERMVVLAGQAIRGVAMGVIVTAVIQTLLGGLGLVIVGVPFASVLTVIMFMLCIAQIGPLIVLLAATVWAWLQLGAGWGSFMLVWALVVGTMDNFVRPVLIKKGADLPLLLIFAGVIGGLIAFGVIGIFVGPVVLAVAFTLIDDWVRGDRKSETPATGAGVDKDATDRTAAPASAGTSGS